ncbi:hypothetical protein BVRB_8g183270 [Beta vulgaris subsp. vulgaris]|nr:hypothetical protein BVRB_8g183270 [Beta vulgaris subsp. vulgaris]
MAPPNTPPPQILREAIMLWDQYDEQQGRKAKPRAQYPQTRPPIHAYYPPMERGIDSAQAARLFGGVMVCEHYSKKPSFGKAR